MTTSTDEGDTWHIDWASATPRRPGQAPRQIVTPVAHRKSGFTAPTPAPPIATAPIQLVDTIALDPSDRRTPAKATPSLTWTMVKAGLILIALITLGPPLLRLLAAAGIYTIVQLNK